MYWEHTRRSHNVKGLLSPHALVDNSDQVPVLLRNLSTRPVKLQKNVVIGTVSEVDQVANGGKLQDHDKTNERFPVELPDHLIDLADRSTRDLTSEQSQSVQYLLLEFQDIFSKGDFDLGLFQGIQHKINTGNAHPVKTKLRRTPLGFRSEEEEHLKSMLDKGIIVPSVSEWSSTLVLVRKKEFEFVRMPFGTCNSPATFQRVIQLVFKVLTGKNALLT